MRKTLSIKNISKLPKKPGVYFLKNKTGEIFYIGKANNIRSRVQSHARESLSSNVHRPLPEIKKIEYIVTANEIEALIKESEYIKKYDPKMNHRLRDDKKYFFVGFTNEQLPRIFITHQPNTDAKNKTTNQNSKLPAYRSGRLTTNYKPPTKYFGPYTDGNALKQTMKYLRKIFPYYSANPKKPFHSPNHKSLPCSWCHLGLCPGPKPNKIEYKKNIKRIKKILRGQGKSVIVSLKKEMKTASKLYAYEKAQDLKNTIEALQNIFLHTFTSPVQPKYITDKSRTTSRYLSKLLKTALPIKSIEGYDISNIQGHEPTGSMVRFDNGLPNKSLYRKFNIQSPSSPDDYKMMQEILERRLSHSNWQYPDMILIDGGRGQLNTALKALKKLELSIPVASLAKREEELYVPNRKPQKLNTMPKEVENLLIYVRDEAHRFAITHHRARHRKQSLS